MVIETENSHDRTVFSVYRIPDCYVLKAVSTSGVECKRKVETGFRDLESVKSWKWC